MRFPTIAVFRVAGLLGCAAMLVSVLLDALAMPAGLMARLAEAGQPLPAVAHGLAAAWRLAPSKVHVALIVVAFAAFALSFWWCTRPGRGARGASVVLALLVQGVAGACVESDLLYLLAAELAFVLPTRAAVPWLLAGMAGYVLASIPLLMHGASGVPRCNIPGVQSPSAAMAMMLDWLLELAFQAFAYGVGHFATAELRARERLAGLHAELAAAQGELEEAVRAREQRRIGARVNQVIGQHLAALNLQLELASRQVDEAARRSVVTSREVAQRLMADVRASVAAQRIEPQPDLRGALLSLGQGLPTPHVVLDCDDAVAKAPPVHAHTVFRVVQEAISNCVRHSGATVLHVAVALRGRAVTVSISDDGRGAREPSVGSGLRGMRERVEAHGGRFSAGNRAGGGYGIEVWLPLPEVAA